MLPASALLHWELVLAARMKLCFGLLHCHPNELELLLTCRNFDPLGGGALDACRVWSG